MYCYEKKTTITAKNSFILFHFSILLIQLSIWITSTKEEKILQYKELIQSPIHFAMIQSACCYYMIGNCIFVVYLKPVAFFIINEYNVWLFDQYHNIFRDIIYMVLDE